MARDIPPHQGTGGGDVVAISELVQIVLLSTLFAALLAMSAVGWRT